MRSSDAQPIGATQTRHVYPSVRMAVAFVEARSLRSNLMQLDVDLYILERDHIFDDSDRNVIPFYRTMI